MSPKILVFVSTLIILNYIIDVKSSPYLTSFRRNRPEIEETNPNNATEDSNKPASLEAWPADKVAVLSSFVETMATSERNITIVAWQRVLNAEGQIISLNSIQLVIPPKPAVELETSGKKEESGKTVLHAKIDQVKKMLAQAEKLGLPASASLEEFNEDGKNELLIYMNKDELFARQRGGIAIYNKTAAITQQEVADFIDNLKPTILGTPTILKYDTDGNLLVDQSEIRPYILGRVTDQYEAPEDILLAGPKIMARVSQQYPKEKIPRQLAIEFNVAFPEYTWRVLVDPVYYHIRKDVALTLTYENFNFEPDTKTAYFVYGIKNE